MKRALWPIVVLLLLIFSTPAAAEQSCIDCHREKTPGAVLQWQASEHAKVLKKTLDLILKSFLMQ